MCYWQEKTFFVLFKRTLNTVYTDYFNAIQKTWNSRVFLNIEVWYSSERRGNDSIYYVAEFDSGQDEENPVFWLATQAHLAYSEFPRQSRKEKLSFSPYNKSFIDQQTCSVKMAGYQPPSILRFYWPCLRLRRKMKDL